VSADGTEISAPFVGPMPEAPDSGLFSPIKYSIDFTRARWQRGKAIRFHRDRVRQDTRVLSGVLYELGTAVRVLGIDNRATAGEMRAIDEIEQRREQLGGETVELQRRQAEENARFGELEGERAAKVAEAETALTTATAELETIESQRRALKESRKTIERQQKAYLETADKRELDAGKLPLGDERTALRRASEDHRRETAALDTERQEVERKLAALERPHAQGTAKVESLKAELVAARRSLEDAREGHRHRLSELDAEHGRKGKEIHLAAGEIHQRLVTLGTIVNLNRVERPELDDLYIRIDTSREAIGERSRLIDRLAAERESYVRGALLRGAAALGLSVIALLAIILVLVASL
jgi:chromosome segregation ATPase